jgi:hypothetical protein
MEVCSWHAEYISNDNPTQRQTRVEHSTKLKETSGEALQCAVESRGAAFMSTVDEDDGIYVHR